MKESPAPAAADIVVIGGGPAGLTAAGRAAGLGARVVLLEGGERPGRKLLLTGRGRCNLTSTLPLPSFLEAYGSGGRFLRNAFSRFFSDELVRFLEDIGVKTGRERGGRIYPERGGARSVLEALERFALTAGVLLQTGHRVRRLSAAGKRGFRVGGGDFLLEAGRVVIATGGASFPWTGSRGDGYALAESLGHTVEPLLPALVPVRCTDGFLARLAGLRLKNVGLSFPSARRRRTFFGEVHFTVFGLSGPAVFLASKEIGLLASRAPLPLEIDLKPALEAGKLDARLLRDLSGKGRLPLSQVMEKLLPRQLAPLFLELAELPPDIQAAEVKRESRRRILRLLKAFPLTAVGTLPLERAMVTAGGVRLKEIDPATMESRIVPGTYFCGEVLDIDGSTGGFNLQAAFSTGFLAGEAAAAAGGGRR